MLNYKISFMKAIKRLSIAITISVLMMWILAFYYYFTLPSTVATHFGVSGTADSYGSKTILLIIPFLFSIAPILILVLTKYRFKIIENYPYLIKLPAFILYGNNKLKDYLIDRYFEAMLSYTLILSISLLFVEVGVFEGAFSGRLPEWFNLAVLIPVLTIVPYLFYLKKLYKTSKLMLNKQP